jgi:hypothetical protein
LTRKFLEAVCFRKLETVFYVSGGKEVRRMAVYTIIRVYEIPADNRYQATDRMLESILLHVEGDFHVKDIIREPGAQPGQGRSVDLRPAQGWLELLRNQLGLAGKPGKK